MKNTIENNLAVWDREYGWPADGDEWDGQARACRQPYTLWKRSVVENLILPNISQDAVVLEIAPGHGRWSKEIAGRVKELVLVDLSPTCIDHCRRLLAAHPQVRYVVNDGKSVVGVEDNSVDFVWSYDAFVHMDRDTIGAYLAEIQRVLRPGGRAAIHHAGRRHRTLWLGFIKEWGEVGRSLYKWVSMGRRRDEDGWRSNISRQVVRGLAEASGLRVEDQLQAWGDQREFGVPRFGDFVTILRKG